MVIVEARGLRNTFQPTTKRKAQEIMVNWRPRAYRQKSIGLQNWWLSSGRPENINDISTSLDLGFPLKRLNNKIYYYNWNFLITRFFTKKTLPKRRPTIFFFVFSLRLRKKVNREPWSLSLDQDSLYYNDYIIMIITVISLDVVGWKYQLNLSICSRWWVCNQP